jgi:YegS/Rv2252/BmrU family lipid kinase
VNQHSIVNRVLVIVNPASGKPEPVLHPLNKVFKAREIEWDVAITNKAGDATRFAQEAVASGVDLVAVYGGDGTVGEVASGLLGNHVPLAILPGGTANTLSRERRIPGNLEQAAALIGDPTSIVRKIDIGQVGDRCFVLRLGTGFAAEPVRFADQERKERLGTLAYVLTAVEAFRATEVANYRITVDGQEIETKGLGCQINNVANVLIPGIAFPAGVVVDDGLLDLVVMGEVDFETLRKKFSLQPDNEGEVNQLLPEIFQQRQGREFYIAADPPHPVHLDGDMFGETAVSAKILPQALSILVPPQQVEAP